MLASAGACVAFVAGMLWAGLSPDRDWLLLTGVSYAGFLLVLMLTGQIRPPRRSRPVRVPEPPAREETPWGEVVRKPEIIEPKPAPKPKPERPPAPPTLPVEEVLEPAPREEKVPDVPLLPLAGTQRLDRLEEVVVPEPFLLDPDVPARLAEAVATSNLPAIHYQAAPHTGSTARWARMLLAAQAVRPWEAVYHRSLRPDDDPALLAAELCRFLAANGQPEPLRELCFYGLPLNRVLESLAAALQARPYLIVFDHLEALGPTDSPAAIAVYRMAGACTRPGALSRIVTITSEPGAPDLPVWLVRRLEAEPPPSGEAIMARLPRLAQQPLSVRSRLLQAGGADLLRYRLLSGLASRSVILDLPELFAGDDDPAEALVRAVAERLTEEETALAARLARSPRALSTRQIEQLRGNAPLAAALAEAGLLDGSLAQGRWSMNVTVRRVMERLTSREGPFAHRALAALEEDRDPVRAYRHLAAARDHNVALELLASASYNLMMHGLAGHLQPLLEGCLERPLSPWSRYLLYHLLGNMLERTGQWDDARLAYEGQLSAAAALGSPRHRAIAWHSLGTVLVNLGDLQQAEAEFARARAVFSAVGDRDSLAFLLNNMGALYRLRQEWDQALAHYQQSLDLKQDLQITSGLARTYHNVRLAHAARNHLRSAAQARRRLRELLAAHPSLSEGLYGYDALAYQFGGGQKVEAEVFEKGMAVGWAPSDVLTPLRRRFDALLGRLAIEEPQAAEPLLRSFAAEARRAGALDLALRATGAAAYTTLAQHHVAQAIDDLLSAAEEALGFDKALHEDLCNYLRQVIQRTARENPQQAADIQAHIRERWPRYASAMQVAGPIPRAVEPPPKPPAPPEPAP